jgi:hypothetical protein
LHGFGHSSAIVKADIATKALTGSWSFMTLSRIGLNLSMSAKSVRVCEVSVSSTKHWESNNDEESQERLGMIAEPKRETIYCQEEEVVVVGRTLTLSVNTKVREMMQPPQTEQSGS